MPASAKTAAILAAAIPTVGCNLEVADLASGAHGEATLSVKGWISELGPSITSPQGFIRLLGQGGDFAAPILVNGERPDVAVHFHMPAAAQSGFLATYAVKRLPAGVYAPYVYRRSPAGWIVCAGPQTLTAP